MNQQSPKDLTTIDEIIDNISIDSDDRYIYIDSSISISIKLIKYMLSENIRKKNVEKNKRHLDQKKINKYEKIEKNINNNSFSYIKFERDVVIKCSKYDKIDILNCIFSGNLYFIFEDTGTPQVSQYAQIKFSHTQCNYLGISGTNIQVSIEDSITTSKIQLDELQKVQFNRTTPDLYIDEYSNFESIYIKDAHIEKIEIKGPQIKNQLMLFKSYVLTQFNIYSETREDKYVINEFQILFSKINCLLNIEDIWMYIFSLNNNIFSDSVHFEYNNKMRENGWIDVYGNKFCGNLYIFIYSSMNFVKLSNNEFLKDVRISPSLFDNIPSIDIDCNKTNNNIIIEGYGEDPKVIINEMSINCNREQKGDIIFSSICINEFHIIDINYSAIYLNRCYLSEIYFNDFINTNFIIFNNCNTIENCTDTKLSITNSTLGATHFVGFDFDSYNSIFIKNSSIHEISTTNVKWFNRNKLNNDESEKNIEYYKNHKEIYRQLKLSMENQKNKIQSLEFRKEELKAHRMILKKQPASFNEYFIFELSYFTNDFGQNWIRPLFFIFCITLLFYIVLIFMVSDNYYILTFFSNLCKMLYVFLKLFNPVRDIDKIFNTNHINYANNINNCIYILDFLHKIVLSFFIFQIIKAFRKYT